MNPLKKTARIAGLLYLIMGITGAFSMLYVPAEFIVNGDAVATAENIMAAPFLFRLGVVSNLVSQTLFIFLVLLLYHLFRDVSKNIALVMVILVLVAVPITFINMLNQVAILAVLTDPNFQNVFEAGQLDFQMTLYLNLFNNGIFIAEIFWGLWLFPFGLLVFRSGFIPKVLGVLLIIGCIAYLVESFTALLVPHFRDTIVPILMIPLSVGEFSIILWLLIMGVKEQKVVAVPHGNKLI